jgi:hypothetical protein
MHLLPGKIITPFLLIAGAAAIAYGMLRSNNYVFIAGIVMAVTGYLLIRRVLKNPAGSCHERKTGSDKDLEH